MTYTVTKKHITEVRAGDTVIHNGKMMTVCANNLKHDGVVVERTLFGDSYMLGIKLVEVVADLKF